MSDLVEAWVSAASAISTEPTMPFLSLDEVFLPGKSMQCSCSPSFLPAAETFFKFCCQCSGLHLKQGGISCSVIPSCVLVFKCLARRIVLLSELDRQSLRQ